MNTAIILCAGSGTRWGDYLGVPKQLAPIGGETLLQRTVRLLRAGGIDNIHIVSHDTRLEIAGCGFFRPPQCRWTPETLLSTRQLWRDRTLLLLGDVFFSEKTLSRIIDFSGPFAVFGRSGPNKFTRHHCSEIFGFSFSGEMNKALSHHTAIAIEEAECKGKARLWQVYRSVTGIPLNLRYVEKDIFQRVDLITDDIDSPEGYLLAKPRYERLLGLHGWGRRWFLLSVYLSPDGRYFKAFCKHLKRQWKKRFRLYRLGWEKPSVGNLAPLAE